MNLTHQLNPAFSIVVEASIHGIVLIALVVIIQRIFRARLGPSWAFALWFLVLLRLSMPWLPVSSLSWQRLAWVYDSKASVRSGSFGGQPAAVVNRPSVLPPAKWAPAAAPEVASAAKGSAWSVASPDDSGVSIGTEASLGSVWTTRLGVAWVLVALGLLARQGLSGWLFGRRLRRWPALDDIQLRAQANHCREQLGIGRSIEIRVASEIESPGLVGLFRPVILLPRQLIKQLDGAEWRHILLHEFAHIKRFDTVWNAWLTILTCVHWFNPLVWYAARRMRADRELACDALVLADANLDDRRSYGHTLLKLAAFPRTATLQQPIVGILEDGGPLKTRLQSLAIQRSFWVNSVLGFALILLLGACALTRLPSKTGLVELEPVDLAKHCDYPTASVESGVSQDNTDDAGMWLQIPKGRQSILGVPFDVTGIIRLAGSEGQRDERYSRPLVQGIPVGHAFGRLYLLHSTYYAAPAGTIIAKAKLNYADGTSAELPIRYGNHTLNYWRQKYEAPVNLSDPESRIAWTGDGPMLAKYGNSLRLCVSSFKNPSPDKAVRSIDLMSTMQFASEVIVGLSVGGEHLPAEWMKNPKIKEPEQNWKGRLRFRAVDGETGKPIKNVRLRWEGAEPESHFRLGYYDTDADGWAELKYPAGRLTYMDIWLNGEGYVPKIFHWTKKRDGEFPEQYVYRAERGARIAGLIEDEQGNPIAGAMVRIEGPRPNFDTEDKEILMLSKIYAISDSTGHWASTVIPKGIPAEQINLRVQHPAYITGGRRQLTANEAEGSDIRIRLTGGKVFTGSVFDSHGRPIVGADIRIKSLNGGDGTAGTKTEAGGSFAVSIPRGPSPSAILCQAAGYAPSFYMDAREQTAAPLPPIILQPGRTVEIDVRDERQLPIEGAMVEAVVGGVFTLEDPVFTGSDGHTLWSQAPDSGIGFNIHRSGFVSTQTANSGESTRITVTLKRAREIGGSVTDAATGKTIDYFQIWRGRSNASDGEINWGSAPVAIGRRGKFRITVDVQSSADIVYRINALGYAPSDPIPASKLEQAGPIKLKPL